MKLTILFGGASYEHEISIVSAITVMEKLHSFDLNFIFCDQDHQFYKIDNKEMKAKSFSTGSHKKMPRLHVTKGGFELRKTFSKELIDAPVLNLIHGGDGEDGAIASILDFYDIAFIGPRKEASVFSFDKGYTKWLAESLGVKTVAYEILRQGDKVGMSLPIIIKPARLGSSIGVSIVKEESELDYALDVAFEFDERVLVEPFIIGVKEYNLAGTSLKNGLKYSIVEEPEKREFLDFDKKYRDFSRSSKANEAVLDDLMVEKLQHAFSKIYTGLFEGALIRCDFFEIDGDVYLNEINPIPGSMAHYLFEDFDGLIRELLLNLPKQKRPQVSYQYIHSINQAKGK
ncbi:MAG: D-alanine--D-alanine ligase [Campylobacterota bacterium]|nr:D-alanine--D-alanine ligase [Campylobacterota bacterium]